MLPLIIHIYDQHSLKNFLFIKFTIKRLCLKVIVCCKETNNNISIPLNIF